MSVNRIQSTLLFALVALALAVSCKSPEYVRDTDRPDLDDRAMSLRLDRKDLDRLYAENAEKLIASKVVKEWDHRAAMGKPVAVAVFPMRNGTSEHIGASLDALLSKFETDLVNQSSAEVVSRENQADLIAEIKRVQAEAYDPARLVKYGRQIGAQYFLTGKVYDVAERVSDERRVQYFMFVQVLDVETGAVRFQNEASVTKGLVR
jgi:penicillin-binding protein activator